MRRLVLPFVVFGSILHSSVHAASADAEVLKIQVKAPGEVVDLSQFHRELNARAQRGKSDAAVILGPGAINIYYDEADPLFGTTAFTYVLKCAFGNLDPFPSPYPIAGRWDALKNGRSIGLCFGAFGCGVTFGVSGDGSTGTISVTKTKALPPDQIVVIVGRYLPGKAIMVAIYDEKGALIEKRMQTEAIPLDIAPAPSASFLVGAPLQYQMSLFQLSVWDVCLSDDELQETLKAASFFN